MCGIIGAINTSWKSDPLEILKHRGPDNQSSYKYNNLYLGHTRLSIQDLSSLGNQPMTDTSGRYTLVFNGEIYNHWDIREKLIKKGYVFRSKSDTETILLSWKEWGTKAIREFKGIFSFAIFDKKQSKLYISRDKYGVKPLYIYTHNNILAFSSEIKVLTDIENFYSKIDFGSIINYLTFLWSPGSKTMYKSINKLLPGQLMTVNIKSLKTEINFSITKKRSFKSINHYSESEWIKKVDEKLNLAVEKQMISDAPIGFFLSGGLDSSLLVAIARSQRPKQEINCFTINQFTENDNEGFENDLFFAKKVANQLDVSLEIMEAKIDWLLHFDKMIWHLDEPQADLAPINVLKISDHARKAGIKVLISGAGGDDLFSGYRRHLAQKINNKLNNIFPSLFLETFSRSFNYLPSSNSYLRRLKKITKNWGDPKNKQMMGFFNWLPNDMPGWSLISQEFQSQFQDYNPYDYGLKILKDIPGDVSELEKLLILEQKTFLIDHNLNYTDKLSMAIGVEARVPYLDFDLVSLSNQIPHDLKLKGLTTKYILKKVAEKYLPKNIIYRKKTGFGAPVRSLIDKDFKELINLNLNSTHLKNQGIFNHLQIERLLSLNDKKKEDYSYIILSLLSMQSWLKQFPWSK
jgi:asparagine synthase (glutamine-hydrolysing)